MYIDVFIYTFQWLKQFLSVLSSQYSAASNEIVLLLLSLLLLLYISHYYYYYYTLVKTSALREADIIEG